MKVVKLSKGDSETLSRLCDLYNEVFDEDLGKPVASHFDDLLNNHSILFFVVLNDSNDVIAGLTAHVLYNIHYSDPALYIYDIAVKQHLQRKGIGSMLLGEVLEYCKANNFQEVFVQADKEDEHAVNFYRRSRGEEKDVFDYSFRLK